METFASATLVVHFIGLAALLGGTLSQLRPNKKGTATVVPLIRIGAIVQLVSGMALVSSADWNDLDPMKITVKFLIATGVLTVAMLHRKRDPAPQWVIYAIGVATLANIVTAVFWR